MLPSLKRSLAQETPEEAKRSADIRRRLINELSITVKELQRMHMGSDYEIDKNDDYALMLCTLLEAAFLHGYHEHALKMSNFYNLLGRISSETVPTHSFWSFLVHVTHKDIVYELENLSHITTPIGLCRAWVRLALNDCLMESYLNSMLSETKKLESFYKPSAFMRDGELPYIMISFLQGLTEFKFHLNYNTPSLNSWTGDTLAYAGVWQLANIASPVPSNRPLGQAAMPSGAIPSSQSAFRPISTKTVMHTYNDESPVRKKNVPPARKKSVPAAPASINEAPPDRHEITKEIGSRSLDGSTEQQAVGASPGEGTDTKAEPEPGVNQTLQVQGQMSGEEDEAPPVISPILMMGSNKLGISTGWSSTFKPGTPEPGPQEEQPNESQEDPDESTSPSLSPSPEPVPEPEPKPVAEPIQPPPPPKVVSYHTLLSDYTVQSPAKFTTPSLHEEDIVDAPNPSTKQIPIPTSPSQDALTTAGFEVVPHGSSVHSEHTDDRTQTLMAVLTRITNEQGLDSQNYQCKGCGRNIGMIYGEAKVCKYDACYYCYECHVDDEHVIPARVIYNWDLRRHRVSRFTKLFLLQIEEEPLVNIDETNPSLYGVVNELHEIKVLRQQLQHLKGFLLTCKDPIADDVRRRIWPREYLWDDIHQYSLLDLIQTQSGQLAHHLKKVITMCTKHVYKCKLCCQKGFICEVCNDPKIIYPFEVKNTTQCPMCKAVFHKTCIADKKCPKCVRRHKQKAAKVIEKSALEFDSPCMVKQDIDK